MSLFLQPAAILSAGVMRLGPLRVSVYGLFAAVGLMAALLLSQRTAQLAGVGVKALWDAGLFAVTAAFVISRGLLILRDVHAFRTLPLVVLSLPSFTYGGMALTAVAVAGYLRWKRLSILAVVDAWAPCAALLAALLSLGHFFEGTDAGMPTNLPWGPVVPGSGGLLHLQPVQIYGAVAALVLFVVLMQMLRRGMVVGMVAAVSLIAGGGTAFLLDMLTQPAEVGGSAWLDPGQWIAVGGMVVGLWMFIAFRRYGSEFGKEFV